MGYSYVNIWTVKGEFSLEVVRKAEADFERILK